MFRQATLLFALITPAVAAAAGDYQLGVGDSVQVHVQGEPELTREIQVAASCGIEVGLIGSVDACGRTTDQLSTEIRERLADGYIRHPQVSVEVTEYVSQKVLVTGAVRSPGEQALEGPTALIEVIAAAGGRTADNVVEVAVIRDGTQTTYQLPELEEGRVVQVVAGDRVVLREGRLVYVQGEVANEGPVVYREGLTVTQALSMAGGPGEFAGLRRAYILRADGEKISVNLRRILEGREAEVPLQPDDKLVVKRSSL